MMNITTEEIIKLAEDKLQNIPINPLYIELAINDIKQQIHELKYMLEGI